MTPVLTRDDAQRAVDSGTYTAREWFMSHHMLEGPNQTTVGSWISQFMDALDEARREGEAKYEVPVRRLSGCLLVIAGTPSRVGGGSIRTAAYEAAVLGASVDDLARKLESPVPNDAVSTSLPPDAEIAERIARAIDPTGWEWYDRNSTYEHPATQASRVIFCRSQMQSSARVLGALDLPALLAASHQAGMEAMRERAAYVASMACLVPPDGGDPTAEEVAVCDEAARRIRTIDCDPTTANPMAPAFQTVTIGFPRPGDCARATTCTGQLLHVEGRTVASCGLIGCKHNWNETLGGRGVDCVPASPKA